MHGNKIFGNYRGIKIDLKCFNAEVLIGENTEFQDCTLHMQSNARLQIGQNGIYRNINFAIFKEAICVIGKNVHICDS